MSELEFCLFLNGKSYRSHANGDYSLCVYRDGNCFPDLITYRFDGVWQELKD